MTDELKGGPFNLALGKLASLRDGLASKPAAPAAKKDGKGPARAVVRMERKGRGGKEVTIVEQLDLPEAKLEAWLKELKNALGCGGTVDRDALVLQGDHRERLRTLLEKEGVRRVSVG